MTRLITILLFGALILSSCGFFGGRRIHGNGNIRKENREGGQFSRVEVSNSFELHVKQDSTRSVTIETDEDLLGYVIVDHSGDVLKIYSENGYNLDPSNSDKVKVYVSSPVFKSLEASGACTIISDNMISSGEPVDIDVTGASEIMMEVKSPKVTAGLTGASTLVLKGETKDFSIEGSGASHIHCFDFLTEQTRIDVSGASEAEVFASVKLDVEASGASDIIYKGNATVSQNISGAGSIKKAQ